MFLLIGLLISGLAINICAADGPKPSDWKSDEKLIQERNQYFDFLGPKARNFLDYLKENVSPTLAEICTPRGASYTNYGVLQRTMCNEFLAHLIKGHDKDNGHHMMAGAQCDLFLGGSKKHDAFEMERICGKKIYTGYSDWKIKWKAQKRAHIEQNNAQQNNQE